MKITLELLRSKGACRDQYQLFERLFKNGDDVTEELAAKAIAAGLDLDWAAANLFTAPASKAYDEATAPASKAYDEARAKIFSHCAAMCDEELAAPVAAESGA